MSLELLLLTTFGLPALAAAIGGEFDARRRQAQRLESLSVMAGGLAHNFNNLLLSILGQASLARADLTPRSPLMDRLAQIEGAAKRAADLTAQMLAFSGRTQLVVGPLSLSKVIEETTHLFKATVSKKASLTFELDPQLPLVEGDSAQLRQVLISLISNASDALDEAGGSITVRTGLCHADAREVAAAYAGASGDRLEAGPYVYLEVTDTGSGMTPETLARIFDPFFTTKFAGRGLGLPATLGIVGGHRGGIAVSSTPGVGTTVRVLLPVCQRPAQTALTTDEEALRKNNGMILVVDDEEGVREIVQTVLERAGFEVLTAADGHDGLELFGQHAGAIRAVLLDMTMPRMNGDEAFCRMRQIQPDVPVILTSGCGEQEAIDRIAEQGLAGFLQKPYRAAELVERFRQILQPGGSPRRTASRG